MHHNCASLCLLCTGIGKAKTIYNHFFHRITGTETRMLLIIFLSLIAKLTSVSGDCDIGPQHVKINWDKVGVSVLTQFLKEAVFKLLLGFYISFVVSITKIQ